MDWTFFGEYWWQLCVVAVLSYAVGDINFAILFCRKIKREDIRNFGSGNAGTTNVFRVFGFGMGALTFVCDALKGVAVCLACRFAFAQTGFPLTFEYWAGLFAVLGHVLPFYHGFRGGKGVATSIGVCLTVQPILTLCCVLPVLLVIVLTDRMSVMSILFSAFMIVWHWTMLRSEIGVVACSMLTAMFALVLVAHRKNIVRIALGKELRTGVASQIFRKNVKNGEDDGDGTKK